MHIHRRVIIECKQKGLWRCLTEPELIRQWVTNMVDEIPDEGARPGLGAKSTIRMREGTKIVNFRCVVTEWKPEYRLGIRFTGGSLGPSLEMDVTYELSRGEDTGTALDFDVDLPLHGFVYKLLAPLIWLGAVNNTKKDLAKLAELAPTILG